MTKFTAKQAAEYLKMSKPGLLKARAKGKISAEKDQNGHWIFDLSEIERYKSSSTTHKPETDNRPPTVNDGLQEKNTGLQQEIQYLRELIHQRDIRLEEKDRYIEDLRRLLPDYTTKETRTLWPFFKNKKNR